MQISLAAAMLAFLGLLLVVGVGISLLWSYLILTATLSMTNTVDQMYVYLQQFLDFNEDTSSNFRMDMDRGFFVKGPPSTPVKVEDFDELKKFFDVNDSDEDDDEDDEIEPWKKS